jgi:hypothetical protein
MLSKLPIEILVSISEYIDESSDIYSLLLVNREWNAVIKKKRCLMFNKSSDNRKLLLKHMRIYNSLKWGEIGQILKFLADRRPTTLAGEESKFTEESFCLPYNQLHEHVKILVPGKDAIICLIKYTKPSLSETLLDETSGSSYLYSAAKRVSNWITGIVGNLSSSGFSRFNIAHDRKASEITIVNPESRVDGVGLQVYRLSDDGHYKPQFPNPIDVKDGAFPFGFPKFDEINYTLGCSSWGFNGIVWWDLHDCLEYRNDNVFTRYFCSPFPVRIFDLCNNYLIAIDEVDEIHRSWSLYDLKEEKKVYDVPLEANCSAQFIRIIKDYVGTPCYVCLSISSKGGGLTSLFLYSFETGSLITELKRDFPGLLKLVGNFMPFSKYGGGLLMITRNSLTCFNLCQKMALSGVTSVTYSLRKAFYKIQDQIKAAFVDPISSSENPSYYLVIPVYFSNALHTIHVYRFVTMGGSCESIQLIHSFNQGWDPWTRAHPSLCVVPIVGIFGFCISNSDESVDRNIGGFYMVHSPFKVKPTIPDSEELQIEPGLTFTLLDKFRIENEMIVGCSWSGNKDGCIVVSTLTKEKPADSTRGALDLTLSKIKCYRFSLLDITKT